MATLIPKTANTEQTYRNDVPYYKDDYYYRYLDLPKLIDLVQSKSLAFPSLSTMEDKNEGVSFRRIALKHHLKTPNLKEEKRKEYLEELKEEEDHIESLKRETFCSCWHKNTYESIFHWKTYGKRGFVIRINVHYMHQFLHTLNNEDIPYDNENYFSPEVSYGLINYHSFNVLEDLERFENPCFVKEQSFYFEQEFRILVQLKNRNQQNPKDSLAPVKIDFSENEFFKFDIYAHPEMPDWEIGTLNNLDIFKEFPIKPSAVFRRGK